MERVMIFIDGSNLYFSMKDIYGPTVHTNFEIFPGKLILFEKEPRKLIRTYFYDAPRIKEENEQKYKKE